MLVKDVLENLRRLTKAQLHTFYSGNETEFMRLDKELELALGEKERRIGALREHKREHTM